MNFALKKLGSSIQLVLIAFLPSLVIGCSDAKQRAQSSDHLRHLARAVIKYHDDNREWPEKMSDLKSVVGQTDLVGSIGDGKDYAALIVNPLTRANPGYEYVKPVDEPKSHRNTIVFYQLRDGKRDTTLPAAFLDGSVRPASGEK